MKVSTADMHWSIALQSQNLSFTVLSKRNGDWQPQGVTADMTVALRSAESLLAGGTCDEVKVDQSFTDQSTNRQVVSTIMTKQAQRSKAGGVPLMVWVALAIVGGGISFLVAWSTGQF